jgi:hypothetical protein
MVFGRFPAASPGSAGGGGSDETGGATDLFATILVPILERFCKDPDDEVRTTIAAGYHAIVDARQKVAGPFVVVRRFLL